MKKNFFAFLDELEYFKKVWFLSENNPPTQSKYGKNHTLIDTTKSEGAPNITHNALKRPNKLFTKYHTFSVGGWVKTQYGKNHTKIDTTKSEGGP